MIIGVIADTHGLLRPEVLELFREVALIIHAGDIGTSNRRYLIIMACSTGFYCVENTNAMVSFDIRKLLKYYFNWGNRRIWIQSTIVNAGKGLLGQSYRFTKK